MERKQIFDGTNDDCVNVQRIVQAQRPQLEVLVLLLCCERMYLRQVLLGNNQLKKLPYSIGFLTSLQTLQVRRTCLCGTLKLCNCPQRISSAVTPTDKLSRYLDVEPFRS